LRRSHQLRPKKINQPLFLRKKMINLILFGPPGSGKGTQAEKLVKKYKLVHISTGDLFRYEMSNNTPLGQEAKAFMAKGELVPDTVTIGMLKNKVEKHPEAQGFIFDGFPRTTPQADALDAFLKTKKQQVSGLIAMEVEDEELVKRLLGRGKTSGRADDNDESIIRNRMAVYKNETAPVFDFYAKQRKSHTIDGIGSILAIFRRLTKIINAF
jgi:adenylate kinase